MATERYSVLIHMYQSVRNCFLCSKKKYANVYCEGNFQDTAKQSIPLRNKNVRGNALLRNKHAAEETNT